MRWNPVRNVISVGARSAATVVAEVPPATKSSSLAPKPFSDIPGPMKLPFLGTAWIYLPIIGYAKILRLYDVAKKHFDKYGSIYKEELPNGDQVVNIFRPEDIQALYTSEMLTPKRNAFRMLEHFRNSRPDIYNNSGILPLNGDLWWKLRRIFQKPMSKVKEAKQDLPMMDKITTEFVNEFLSTFDQPFNYLECAAYRHNLELMWMVLFGERLNCWSKEHLEPSSLPSRLIEATLVLNSNFVETDNTEEKWKKKKTEAYLKSEKSLLLLEDCVLKAIAKLKARGNLSKDNCIAAKYLTEDELDEKDVNGILQDFIVGGIDTTSNSTGFMLYLTSQNQSIQEKLHEEAKRLINGPATPQALNEAKYAKAVIKETMRLMPISIGNARQLTKDLVLHGYLIPKDTLVVAHNMTACSFESNFPRANEFLPDRWLEGSQSEKSSPYLVLPFSTGLRSCIARRRAEYNLLLITLRLYQRYKVKWHGAPKLGIITPFINKPDSPVLISLEKR